MAASMGTIISSGAKGKCFMLPNAEYLIHQSLAELYGTNKLIWRLAGMSIC